jgi:signal transduction histidine kinase
LFRLARWYDERPLAGDAVLAVLLLAFVVPSDLASSAADLAFSLPLVACVPFRRRAPVAVFVGVSLLCLVQLAVLDHIVTGDFVALIALYTVVAYGPGTWLAAAATACAVVGALLAALRWRDSTDASTLNVAVSTVGSVLLAATLGAWRHARQARLAALRQERDQQAAVGAALERARIARELHDVIAHSLSVIVVQADGAAAGAERLAALQGTPGFPDGTRPVDAAAALRTIGDTGREALGQMRRLLGVLRDEADVEMAPQPGAAQLEPLVASVARAGVPASLTVEGRPRELVSTVDVTVYRVAQEALTNVLKHAGPVSRVDVVLRYGDEAVELLVRDDGRGVDGAGDGRGQGLRGMRERVDVHDGRLAAGPAAGGGFEVRATLPAPV